MEAVAPRILSQAERLAWLRLIRTENVGPITFRQLLRRFGSAGAALDALPDLARRGGRARPIRICPAAAARDEIGAIEALDARLLTLFEPDYPPALAALDDAPPVITCFGHPHLLQRHAVAMVGARNASANGCRLARLIAAELGTNGLLVVSGMARGIDAAAHQGALDTGTVAVVAGGIDVIYPEENAALYGEIKARGVVLSEMPVGTVPQARHFPRRNRLISGIAMGTLVVEAAPRSGSLITARCALDQGREVFAVPGSPLDPRARGCNDLIRQGAVLVESAADVLKTLAPSLRVTASEPKMADFQGAEPIPIEESEVAKGRGAVEELLSPTPAAVDEVIRQCQVSAAIVHVVLLELELAGRLERHPGNRVSLIAGAPA
ncbi:MAG TPA: DNA-processing protein DprA [Kiloniellales bacterium]|jgi:DNA processing protein